jgi:hypothetical protein
MTAFNGHIASRLTDLDALAARALSVSLDHELSDRRIAQLDDYLDRH